MFSPLIPLSSGYRLGLGYIGVYRVMVSNLGDNIIIILVVDPIDELIDGFVTTGRPLINAKVEPIEVSGSVQDAFWKSAKYSALMRDASKSLGKT